MDFVTDILIRGKNWDFITDFTSYYNLSFYLEDQLKI